MIASSSTFHDPPQVWGSPYLGRVIRVCSVCSMLYCMVRKHKSTTIIQGKMQPPRISPKSSGRLPAVYPDSSSQQRSQCSLSGPLFNLSSPDRRSVVMENSVKWRTWFFCRTAFVGGIFTIA